MDRMADRLTSSRAAPSHNERAVDISAAGPAAYRATPAAESRVPYPALAWSEEAESASPGKGDVSLPLPLPSVAFTQHAELEAGEPSQQLTDSACPAVKAEVPLQGRRGSPSPFLRALTRGQPPPVEYSVSSLGDSPLLLFRQPISRLLCSAASFVAVVPGRVQVLIGKRLAVSSMSAFAETRSFWDSQLAVRPLDGVAAVRSLSVKPEEECNDGQGGQSVPAAGGFSTSQMVKSVSPAGVVRIGGRNRRKRTKYDLAYKQMEELGRFEEEAKSIDLSKVSGSSFALELLSNPQQYSYEAWKYGYSWPVGADGRRLLLRKLRGVYWSNPEKWQRVLEQHNLYRRDLFTLATVQDLFKVTHLMGAEAWDFLLKCTALTQKCDALSSKDIEVDGLESSEMMSPLSGPRRAPQSLGKRAYKSEEGVCADPLLDESSPCEGFLRKRMACGDREEKDVSKRTRGRPRKPRLNLQEQMQMQAIEDAFGPEPSGEFASVDPEQSLDGSPRWLNGTEVSRPAKVRTVPPLESALSELLKGHICQMEDLCAPTDHGMQNAGADLSERQRLVAAALRADLPNPYPSGWCQETREQKCAASGPDARVLGVGKANNVLKLATHYTFMAQFMQCCMLVEVQRTLLRLAEGFKPTSSGDRGFEKKTEDPTVQACVESLVESSNIHMRFVEVIVEQLRLQGELNRLPSTPERQREESKLQQHHEPVVDNLPLVSDAPNSLISPSDISSVANGNIYQDFRMLSLRGQERSPSQASEGDSEVCSYTPAEGQPSQYFCSAYEGPRERCGYSASDGRTEQCLYRESDEVPPEQGYSPTSQEQPGQCFTSAYHEQEEQGPEPSGEEPQDSESERPREAQTFRGPELAELHRVRDREELPGPPMMLCHGEASLDRRVGGLTT
ncbi:hypothetical protein Efla_001635 [Eimeria flavescens]